MRVRAEARLELRVGRAPGVVTVSGTLRDDLGQPLGDRAIEVRVQDASGTRLRSAIARSDAQGAFGTSFPLETGLYRVIAAWEGDEGHPRIEVPHRIDLTRAHVRLEVDVRDGRLDLDEPAHELVVRASSEEGGAGLGVEVRDELERLLARGTTDAEGRARFTIQSARLGPPAAGRLIARTPGDDRRGEAQTEVPVVRYRRTVLTLQASAERARQGETIELSGQLTDSAGPLARRAVGLFAGGEHLDTVLTDDRGGFSRSVALESRDGAPSVSVEARFASDAPWRPPASAAPITIAIDGAGSTPWSWLLAPMIACALAVGVLSRRRGGATPGKVEPATRPATPGIAPARALGGRAPTIRSVGGVVVDAGSGAALPHARIALTRAGERVEAASGADGRFEIAPPDDDRASDPAGWTLDVSAPGYERCASALRLPHRGEWSDATVRLRSLREIALAHYRAVADALAPGHRWWAFWTPRELVDRARTGQPELEELTAAVERAVYAGPHPDEAEVAAIAERSERVAGELERP